MNTSLDKVLKMPVARFDVYAWTLEEIIRREKLKSEAIRMSQQMRGKVYGHSR